LVPVQPGARVATGEHNYRYRGVRPHLSASQRAAARQDIPNVNPTLLLGTLGAIAVRRKDGKEHRAWSVVENRRVHDGRVVQRQVLYLGEINDSQRSEWSKAIEVFDESAGVGEVGLG
jgi:hypothetical protein